MGLITPKTPNFDWLGSDVIACSHCGLAQPASNQQFRNHMVMLQGLRDWWGNSLHIISGWRCPAHNKAEGGSKDSQHLIVRGKDPAFRFATDLRLSMPSVHVPPKLQNDAVVIFARRALDVGFTGVGVYAASNTLHLDLRSMQERERPAVWGDRLDEWIPADWRE